MTTSKSQSNHALQIMCKLGCEKTANNNDNKFSSLTQNNCNKDNVIDSSHQNNGPTNQPVLNWNSNFQQQQSGLITNFVAFCSRFVNHVDKQNGPNQPKNDDWEIPYESIKNWTFHKGGSQGAVYLGTINNVPVAIKKVEDKSQTDIRHLKKLNHRNIVAFKGVCTNPQNGYCIIMEFCPFGTLHDSLRSGKQIPPCKLADWSQQIANGMRYLHSHNIIHRDLKPPNVLLTHDDVLKISDFGTHKSTNLDIPTRMTFAGTDAYMAPEIIRGEPYGSKVDIWSFGVVLWELLTCEAPYKDLSPSAILWGVGHYSLNLLIPHDCPDGFRLLLSGCWRSEPAERLSFQQICQYLGVAAQEINRIPKQRYYQMQAGWKKEINTCMSKLKYNYISPNEIKSTDNESNNDNFSEGRRQEMENAQRCRQLYEQRLDQVNNIYMDLWGCILQLEREEREFQRKERAFALKEQALAAREQDIIARENAIAIREQESQSRT